MRRSCLYISGLLILLLFSTSFLNADEKTLKLESVVLESFDGPGTATYRDGTAVDWQLHGSKFSTEGYPRMTYVQGVWPDDLFGTNPDNADQLQVFGVNTQYDRQGYNQVEIIPGRSDSGEWVAEPLEIPGRVKMIDLWVWGSNFNYSIEIHLMDYQGLSYRLDLIQSDDKRNPGSIKFAGWKNMFVDIPSYIKQSVTYKPEQRGLSITKLVVHTHPNEKVTDNYMYIDHLKVLSDLHETYYDGYDLTDRDRIEEIWGEQ